MDITIRVAQIAVETILEYPDDYSVRTMREVCGYAASVGVSDFYTDMLSKVIDEKETFNG